MTQLLVKHKVKDYAKWKPIFNEHAAKRKEAGSKGGHLFQSAKDPNEVVLLFQWEDLGKARKFAESEDLRQAMERAGVIGKPEVYFLNQVEQFTV
jgi:heme-degrading monooxygenase HmoA